MSATAKQPFYIKNLHLPTGAKPLILLWVPPGSFMMGAHPDEPNYSPEDGPIFQAILTAGFWLAQYPITQAHWMSIMSTNPSHFRDGTGNCPVENVSWHEAMSFCEQLNRFGASELPSGYRFSLPTEMQWEYACRAGTTTMFAHGSSEEQLTHIAWYAQNSQDRTHPVGEKAASPWGFYDMHGNVFEWCYDNAEDYPPSNPTDHIGKRNPAIRVFRGGSYATSWNGGMSCASRGGGNPDIRRPWIGFRLCLQPLQFE